MASPSGTDIDIWQAIFEQTPKVFRWVLGIMTLGIFTMLSILYRWHREDLRRVHERVDLLEARIEKRLDEVNGHLIEIASNTRHEKH